MGPTEEQLTTWRRFASQFPEAARNINEEARRTDNHNTRVAKTQSHGQAGRLPRWNAASVVRTNIANGYTPEDVWPRIARGFTA